MGRKRIQAKRGPHKKVSLKKIDGKSYVFDRQYSTLSGAQKRIKDKPSYKMVKYFDQYQTYRPWGYL